jgi:hypothetical protein
MVIYRPRKAESLKIRSSGTCDVMGGKTSRLFEIAAVLVRLDRVALTDLTHFRIFPRNLAPDFTHYFSEPPEMSSQ